MVAKGVYPYTQHPYLMAAILMAAPALLLLLAAPAAAQKYSLCHGFTVAYARGACGVRVAAPTGRAVFEADSSFVEVGRGTVDDMARTAEMSTTEVGNASSG
eukprot:TRINITY_DN3642_c0_g1_i7.p2 TRINITY_DN3642_c0_g1~~TRINITY_DN3642_c0_g1_i7.p2  ORF type:complete len:102 (+),score=23.02 TRINITY_DN3642_c0_g1_i7:140-445(+)